MAIRKNEHVETSRGSPTKMVASAPIMIIIRMFSTINVLIIYDMLISGEKAPVSDMVDKTCLGVGEAQRAGENVEYGKSTFP